MKNLNLIHCVDYVLKNDKNIKSSSISIFM
jgi:hypothetical protein